MLPDINRLRLQLARQQRALWQLDVVEAAEHVVRLHHRQMVDDELSELYEALAMAQRTLGMACNGDDLTFIFAAEEHICGIRRRADLLRRRGRDLDVAAAKARSAYLAERQRMRELVCRLQFMLTRFTRRPAG